MKAEPRHPRDVLAWQNRVGGLELNVSTAVCAETQNRYRNTEIAVCLAGKETRWPWITDARPHMVASMDGVGTGIEAILVWMGDKLNKMWLDLSSLIRDSLSVACDELINPVFAEFTVVSIDASAGPSAGSFSAGEAVRLRGSALLNLECCSF